MNPEPSLIKPAELSSVIRQLGMLKLVAVNNMYFICEGDLVLANSQNADDALREMLREFYKRVDVNNRASVRLASSL